MKKSFFSLLITGALVAASGAQAANELPFYLSVNAGSSDFKLEQASLGARVAYSERGIDLFEKDKKDNTYALHAGYQITANLALEVGYTDLGQATYGAVGKPCTQDQVCIAALFPPLRGKLSASAWDFSAVGKMALAEKWYGYGKLGVSTTRIKRETAEGFIRPVGGAAYDRSGTKSTTVPKLALGVGYQLTPATSMQLEWDHYFKRSSNDFNANPSINTATLGLKVDF